MADMTDTLKQLLGDNADEKISSVLSALSSSDETAPPPPDPVETVSSVNALSPELLLKAQGLMGALSSGGNDSRSRLLMSLKPYMRESRKNTIDNAIKLLNIAQLAQIFKGGLDV